MYIAQERGKTWKEIKHGKFYDNDIIMLLLSFLYIYIYVYEKRSIKL
jgi:hypothetical protein